MSLPARHAITEAKVFRMKEREAAIVERSWQRGVSLGASLRKKKRGERLATRWMMMWFKLKRINPRETAVMGVMPSASTCWDNAR